VSVAYGPLSQINVSKGRGGKVGECRAEKEREEKEGKKRREGDFSAYF